jgi:hypothetical protein
MSLQADTPEQLQTDNSKVDGKPKDQSNPPPYPVTPASSVAIDIPVNPKPPTPSDADQPLPPLSTLHAQLKEISVKYICCNRQIIAAREALRKDCNVFKPKSQRRALTSTKKLQPTLAGLVNALADLDGVQWVESLFKPFQRSTASDIGKVLQDLDSFAGEVNKFSEYSRFFAFHGELVWKDATQLIGPQAPDVTYLLQACERLERRVKGVNTLLTGEIKK